MSKKRIKPLAKPGFTMFNNYILDHIMPALSHTGWKVLCVAIRYTIGWADEDTESGRKEQDRIAYSQFLKGTGIKSSTTLSKAIQEALRKRYLLRRPSGTHAQMWDYSLNMDYEIEIETSSENGQVVETSPENGEVPPETSPENGHTKESLKETGDEERNMSADAEDFSLPAPTSGMDLDLPEPSSNSEPHRYVPGPGQVVACEDPDTGEEVGEPDWRFPQTQVQHQAFNATGRIRFASKAEWNKLRRIEKMLDSGEMPLGWWENRVFSAGRHRWSFPNLLKYTLNTDKQREWEASQR